MHTHSIRGFSISVWNEARKRGIRVVHTTHDYYLMCLRSDMFPGGDRCDGRCLKCRVGTAGRRYWANKLDGIISVSKFVLKAHWSRGYFRDVPASLGYNVSLGSNARGRLTVGYPAEPLVFGFIGRLEKQKGIETLLAATRLLSGTNWRLRIAGSGRDVLVMKLRKEYPDPRIEWLGYIEPASFYASIHVTIVASVWDDPLPYVAIESLEHGTALIAARSGGIPEIAALGRVVETFPAGDVKALAARMEAALLRIDRWRTGGFMERSSARMFTPDSVAAKHRERYKDAGVAVNPMVPAPADHSCITR